MHQAFNMKGLVFASLLFHAKSVALWPCGPVAEGLKFGTSPKSHHVDDTGSSPVRAETFTGFPTAKSTYR